VDNRPVDQGVPAGLPALPPGSTMNSRMYTKTMTITAKTLYLAGQYQEAGPTLPSRCRMYLV